MNITNTLQVTCIHCPDTHSLHRLMNREIGD